VADVEQHGATPSGEIDGTTRVDAHALQRASPAVSPPLFCLSHHARGERRSAVRDLVGVVGSGARERRVWCKIGRAGGGWRRTSRKR
jgi:hypothetical protein